MFEARVAGVGLEAINLLENVPVSPVEAILRE